MLFQQPLVLMEEEVRAAPQAEEPEPLALVEEAGLAAPFL